MRLLQNIFRFLIPLGILGACVYGAWWLISNPPVQETMEVPPTVVRVEGTVLHAQRYELKVKSQGTVQPRTRSTLLPEVSGKIIEMSPSFRPGGFFTKGEVLMKLDPIDYETAIIVAKAAEAQAQVILAEEKARAEQAHENWKTMGHKGNASAFVLRVPQLAKAEADVASAKARVMKSERDLERTIIRAPYTGQVLEQAADVGQFVNQGSTLGRIFAVDYVEIRLPLPELESQFLTLPQPFREEPAPSNAIVALKANLHGKTVLWQGRIVRVESSLDEQTRQTMAIAQVTDPYARRSDGAPPLTIGAFVEAEIAGDALEGVYVIPRNAVRAGNEIILINRPQNTLRRLTVDPLVSTEKHIVISAKAKNAPKDGDVLCLTPIPFPADGARVLPTIDGSAEPAPAKKEKEKKSPIVSQKAA